MKPTLSLLVGAILGAFVGSVSAQTFTLAQRQVELCVAPGFNHTTLNVAVITNASGLDANNLVVATDSSWVMPAVDAVSWKIVLSFATSNLINQSYTATINASLGGETNTIFVTAYVSALNIFKLKDDPLRSRTYGIQQNGLGVGSVVVLDPITTNHLGNVTVGRKPSDLAESADGRELFVINCVDESVSVIDLDSLTLKQTLTLPAFDNWGQNDTTANIATGPSNILYYTDGAWAPALRVLDRASMQVVQTVFIDGNGFGDLALTHDKRLLFGWAQYGWSAGWAGSYIAKFNVGTNGTLTLLESTDANWPTALGRDPLETPVLISDDDQTVFVKQLAVDSASVKTVRYSFPSPVYSITPGGQVAVTDTTIYETKTGLKLADLPRSAPVQAISSDYSRFIYFDPSAHLINVLRLLDLIGPNILNGTVSPADGSIALSPARLEWSPLPGVNFYNVYLGESESAVAAATTNSPLFLGSVTQPFYQLPGPLAPGTTYFWRVDAVTPFDVTVGDVKRFTVSSIACVPNMIDLATVQGHRDLKTSLNLNSEISGLPWQASSDQSWVRFPQTVGATPATVQVVLDASQLTVGLHQAHVTISSGTNALFSIPVSLRVDPLSLTVMQADPGSVFVYAISEDTSATPARAYLLEINTITESIQRVARVGSSVTDLAVHKGDNRIYVPNWSIGALLAIDLTSFELVRSYAFSPFGGVGYSQNDIYRVSAGGPGRLVWEEEDQWIDISIFDTIAGTNMASAFVREGGGKCSPNKRYYYHGDDNISNASIHKYDLIGDKFSELASTRVTSYSYYGSRTVVVSEDGTRVFWNGGVFDADLHAQWTISDEIYAASADGRYAFGNSSVYDTENHSVVASVAPATSVKAFNSLTGKLVYKGSNSIAFFKLNSQRHVTPPDGSILASPPALQWEGLPISATYRVYLGQSGDAVAAADTNSPLWLGEVVSTNFVLNPLAAGAYFWRVDAVTQYGTVTGSVHSFIVSDISPIPQAIDLVTFPDRPVSASLTLSSLTAGVSWQAAADSNWILLNQSNGTTPATIQITLDASVAAPLVRTGSITISGVGGKLFSVPVRLSIEALYVTILKSDPASAKVYAISENPTNLPTRAYLLEINTATESIERVVGVGSSVTDLSVHNGDNRIYVPNWLTGSLLAIDKSTFQQVRAYTFAPFGGVGYSEGDVYRVAAGAPGRLVVEEEDQWIDISIFDTAAGTILTNAFVREGGGAFGGGGRYYYHGDNNSSGAEIHQFDVTGDQFTELAHKRVESVSYYGSRTVVVSEDGSRVFWNGSAFDPNLVELWTIGDEIFSTSKDGRYACSSTKIYDTVLKQPVLGMPASTAVSAFNSTSQKLVAQVGGNLQFFALTSPLSLPAPVLSAGAVTYGSVMLNWSDRSLEQSFTLQKRIAGSLNWDDIAAPAQNTVQFLVTGLVPQTTYEFRIKANGSSVSSDWSGVLTVTTPGMPPSTPNLYYPVTTTAWVELTWSDPADETELILERSIGSAVDWQVLARLVAGTTAFTDTNVVALTNYYYRIKARNNFGESAYSTIQSVTVPAPAPPPAPSGLVAVGVSGSVVIISWNDVLAAQGYRLERRTEDPLSWSVIATLAAHTVTYSDTNVVQGTQYFYRVQAFNDAGASSYSNEDDAVPYNMVSLLADSFDPRLNAGVWAGVSAGVATNGGQGFRGNQALWFGGSGLRSATTVPLDISRGARIDFVLRAGNEAADGNAFWNNSEPGEGVVLEYSTDGSHWVMLQSFNTIYPSLSNWTSFSLTVPAAGLSPQTQFRWRQVANSGAGYDCWALDELRIVGPVPAAPAAPPFIISSANSSTSIAIFWIGVDGATSYVIERRASGGDWVPLATLSGLVTYYTDAAALPASMYSYRVQAANAGGVSPYSTVTTSATLGQMQEWLQANYGDPNALDRAAMEALEPDGTRPLLRYAFNLTASEPSRTFLPGSSSGGFPAIWVESSRQRLCVEFVRRKASANPGIVYRVQFSSTVSDWNSEAVEISTTSIDTLWERVRYEDSLDTRQTPFRFCRVTLTWP